MSPVRRWLRSMSLGDLFFLASVIMVYLALAVIYTVVLSSVISYVGY
jgi:hypothetical protein